jgi:hypothetical protein
MPLSNQRLFIFIAMNSIAQQTCNSVFQKEKEEEPVIFMLRLCQCLAI